jgi:hypothetical protein
VDDRALVFKKACGSQPTREELVKMMGSEGRSDTRWLRAQVRQFISRYLPGGLQPFSDYDYNTTMFPLIQMTGDHMNLTHLQGRKKWSLITTAHVIHAILHDDNKNLRHAAKQGKKRADKRALARANPTVSPGNL